MSSSSASISWNISKAFLACTTTESSSLASLLDVLGFLGMRVVSKILLADDSSGRKFCCDELGDDSSVEVRFGRRSFNFSGVLFIVWVVDKIEEVFNSNAKHIIQARLEDADGEGPRTWFFKVGAYLPKFSEAFHQIFVEGSKHDGHLFI